MFIGLPLCTAALQGFGLAASFRGLRFTPGATIEYNLTVQDSAGNVMYTTNSSVVTTDGEIDETFELTEVTGCSFDNGQYGLVFVVTNDPLDACGVAWGDLFVSEYVVTNFTIRR